MNTSNNTKSFFAIQSANGKGVDGLHASSSWLNTGYTKIKDESLFITLEGDTVSYSLDGVNYTVPVLLTAEKALYEGLQAKDTSLVEQLEIMAAGYLNKQQRNYAETNKEAGNPVARTSKVLTAEQYKANCIKLAAINPVALYNNISGLLSDTKVTKDKLLSYLELLAGAFMSEEQTGTYNNMLAEEEKVAKQFESLTTNGFTQVARIAADTISARLASKDAENIKVLAELGYALKSTTFDAATFELIVLFAESK